MSSAFYLDSTIEKIKKLSEDEYMSKFIHLQGHRRWAGTWMEIEWKKMEVLTENGYQQKSESRVFFPLESKVEAKKNAGSRIDIVIQILKGKRRRFF